MKVALFLCVVLSVVSIVFSGMARFPKEPSKPGDCYHAHIGPMQKGEKKDIAGKCEMVECDADGTAIEMTCGTEELNGKEPDYSKPYPKCCVPSS